MNRLIGNRLRTFLSASIFLGATTFACTVPSSPQAVATPPPQASVAQAAPCCGPITPDGLKLEHLLDSMHVDQLWQPHVHIDWETGQPDRPADYRGPGRSSHCSAFAAAVGERLHIYLLRPPDHSQIFLASAQAEWFHSSQGVDDGWHPLDGANRAQKAQELANEGDLVTIVYESPNPWKPGHIVVVRPSEKSAAALAAEGPQIIQAGAENHDSFIAAQAFNHHPGAWPNNVHYYWHNVNWPSLQ